MLRICGGRKPKGTHPAETALSELGLQKLRVPSVIGAYLHLFPHAFDEEIDAIRDDYAEHEVKWDSTTLLSERRRLIKDMVSSNAMSSEDMAQVRAHQTKKRDKINKNSAAVKVWSNSDPTETVRTPEEYQKWVKVTLES
jgi:hypothetical protein